MILTILGCGTIIAQKPCARCSGYLIDNRLLIDCGPGIWHALCNNETGIQSIEAVLLSHFHVDHTSDLAAIMMTQYLSKKHTKGSLVIAGPLGLIQWYNQLTKLAGQWLNDFDTKLIEIDKEEEILSYTIQARSTEHTDNSLCYRITNKYNKVIFFSGDSDYNENLIMLATESDIAIIEASNTDETKIEGHLTPQLAAEIASRAQVKKLLLTHMYPEVKVHDAIRVVSKIYDGEVKIAREGMIFHI